MKNEEYNAYNDLFPSVEQSFAFETPCLVCRQNGYAFTGKDCIWGNGNVDANIMIIGKDSAGADTKEPVWKGSRVTLMPLTNKKTGAKMRILLHKADIDPFSVVITNTVKCNIGYDDFNVSYTQLVKSCSRYLTQEIRRIHPKMIITLGADAQKSLNSLCTARHALAIINIASNELLANAPPFLGTFASGVTAEIWNFKHPSYVEGETRECHYVNNLKTIQQRLDTL